ncbi:MAG: glycerate kinase [Vallitaleaceae bacterium]|nr:glycerate kinase [Vallitaleaceae bacterium]
MNKILVATDSFKGTIGALKICEIISSEIKKVFPECTVVALPIADGGEGTVDSLVWAAKGETHHVTVKGPLFEEQLASFGIINGDTAIIEMASAAGLPLMGKELNPALASTYGVGELILKALDHYPKTVVIGLGGSATNDAGCGLAAALGVEFFDKYNEKFIPTGATLSRIHKISKVNVDKRLEDISIIAMSDVDNILYGPTGAACVFGPQKGANMEMVEFLDDQLKRFSEILKENDFSDISELAGGGAAGGLGAGLSALFNVELVSGIEMILDLLEFDKHLLKTNMVITGEGRIDGQSTNGKVLTGICKRTKALHIPVCVISGQSLDDELDDIYDFGVAGVFTINRKAVSFERSAPDTDMNLRYTVRNIMEYTKALHSYFMLS